MGIDIAALILSGAMGSVLGFFYFGGLWWTINQLHGKNHPHWFLAMSYLVRTGIVLGGFWLLLDQGILCLLTALGMLFLVRWILTRKLGKAETEVVHGHQS